MSPAPLTLRQLSGEEVRARQLLGSGVSLPFTHSESAGRLELYPLRASSPSSAADMTMWRCRHGEFALSNAIPVLGYMASCPVTLPETPETSAEWFWALYNDCLPDELKTVLGMIEPSAETANASHERLQIGITVHAGGSAVQGVLLIDSRTLLALLSQRQWRSYDVMPDDDFVCELPLVLGHLTLPLQALNDLQPGDVVVPQEAFFDPQGRGVFPLLKRNVPVIVDLVAGQMTITHHGDIENDA